MFSTKVLANERGYLKAILAGVGLSLLSFGAAAQRFLNRTSSDTAALFSLILKRLGLATIAPAALLVLLPSLANADLLGYSFTSVSGEERSLQPTAEYANPKGNITFALSAGVDRRIRVSIVQQSSDSALSTQTSHLIGANDRIIVDGNSHYGTRLQLLAPGQGRYRIKAEIISADLKSVAQVDYYPLVIDTEVPSAGVWNLSNKTFGQPYGWDTSGSVWYAGCYRSGGGVADANNVQRSGITDVSGLASGYAEAFYKDGPNANQRAGRINLAILPGGVVNGGSLCDLFPVGQQRDYVMKWHIFDKAGNSRVITQELFWDNEKTAPAPFAVYVPGAVNDAGLADFKPYQAGMTVQHNPLRAVFKIPDTNWHETNKGGLSTTNASTVVAREGGYTYVEVECMIGNNDACGRFVDRTSWSISYIEPLIKVTLGSGATVPPDIKDVQYRYSDIGWGAQSRLVQSTALPVSISQIRTIVATRPYRQLITVNGQSCLVEPGADSCIVNWSLTMSPGTWGYIHGCCVAQGFPTTYSGPAIPPDSGGPVVAYKQDDTRFASRPVYPTITWNDRVKPQLRKTENSVPNSLDATVIYQPQGGLQYSLNLKSVTAIANGKTFSGKVVSISGDETERVVRFDLGSLPDGQHTVQVVMEDSHANSVKANAGTILIDRTAPVVNVTAKANLASLDEVLINISDAIDLKPRLKSVTLLGGPAKEHVELAWSEASTGTFKLEYPIVFPSMTDGGKYNLQVTAVDAHGNEKTVEHTFVYSPPTVSLVQGLGQGLRIPAIAHEFLRNDGSRIIQTEPLILKDGSVVQGTYDVFATLRSDAKASLIVNGVRVDPGQTLSVISQHNFAATGGRISIPMRAADAGVTGNVNLLVTTSAPNAPVLLADIEVWMPKVSVGQEVPDPVQAMTNQSLTLVSAATNLCEITSSEALARASNTLTAPTCLLEWTRVPRGLEIRAAGSADRPMTKLAGRFRDSGDVTVGYRLYVYDIDGSRHILLNATESVFVNTAQASFTHSLEGKTVRRAVDNVLVNFSQKSAPSCLITSNADTARKNSIQGGPLTCLVEFTTIPVGLEQTRETPPELNGKIMRRGEHDVAWQASIYDADGVKLSMGSGSSVITVVDPLVTTKLKFEVNESATAVVVSEETFPQAWARKTYSILSSPQNGSVVATASGFRYTPKAGYIGQDSFTYRVTDDSGMFADGTSEVGVVQFNYPPQVDPVSVTALRNARSSFALEARDPNVWDSHKFEIVSQPSPAGVKVSVRNGQLQVDPVQHWFGEATFTYRAVDLGGLKSEPAEFRVSIPLGEDAVPPAISFKDPTSCMAPSSLGKFLLLIEDYDSGVDVASVTVQARFNDASLDMPFRVVNIAEVESDQSLGVSPRKLTISPDVIPGSALEKRLNAAFFEIERNGGRSKFDLLVSASDLKGNQQKGTFTVDPYQIDDRKAPVVTIQAGETGTLMRHLADLAIVATDDLSGIHAEEIVATVSFGDAAAPIVFSQAHSVTKASDDACYSRHPLRVEYRSLQSSLLEEEALGVLSQAYIAGEKLTLSVTVSDYAGNKGSKTVSFGFAPEIHTTNAVSVPAVKHQFRDSSGSPTITISAEDVVHAPASSVTFMAIASMESGAPVAVNGKTLAPGQPVSLGAVSLEEGQKLSLDIRADETGHDGEAAIMLIPLSDNARSVLIPVHVWKPEIELSSANWNPVQLFEQASVSPAQLDPHACKLTTFAELSLHSDKIRKPVCLFTWEATPPDTYGLPYDPPEMVGFIPQPGAHAVSWSVLFFDDEGGQYVMSQGEQNITVKPAAEVLQFGLGKALDQSFRMVSNIAGGLKQEEGPRCSLVTTSDEVTYDMSARNKPACLVTWTALPDGVFPDNWTDEPSFSGVFNQAEGDAKFAWAVSSYSTSGSKVELISGAQTVTLRDPPAPTIKMDQANMLSEGLYKAPMKGGLIGDFSVEAINAKIAVAIKESGVSLSTDESIGGMGQRQTYRGRLLATEKPLWSRTPLEVDARYTNFPEVNAQMGISVLAVPDEHLRPDIKVASTEVLNTEGLSVETWIGHPLSGEPFSTERMGEWDIRLLNYLSFSKQEPLTDYEAIDPSGRASFDLDLLGLESNYIRVMPEARLRSPVPEYQRTVMGSRPLYITVLRGEAIDSRIDARRIRGEAPLKLMAKVDLTDRLDYKALGDVNWEIKKIGSGDWETVPNNSTISERISHVFQVGRYEMRAHVFNKNSGKEFVTEAIEIHAYEKPRMTIQGPANAFIGDQARLRVRALLNGVEVDHERMMVEWSEDNGETWVQGGGEYSVSRPTEERVMLMSRLRMKDSPEDWEDSYVRRRHRVAFRPVSPPRGSIIGARVVEEGVPVNWRGRSRPPYPRMDVSIKGRFVLPDGKVVDEEAVQYLPTQTDAKGKRIQVSYESWIEGFEDQGARSSVTRTISVWQYVWPDWNMNVRASATQAPAEIDLRIGKPVGMGRYLEDVQYEWEIPAGAEVITSRTVDSRSLRISEPGVYPVKVRITDRRGNFTELVEELKIDKPDPWEVDFRISMSNADSRAPLDLRLSPNVRGGHPQDRIDTYRYLVNGEAISDGIRYSGTTLEAGKHEVALEIHSQMGQVVRHVKEVEVKPNTSPVCELQASEASGRWRFLAKCTDETGRVARHVWAVNGEPVALSGSRITVSSRVDTVMEVTLKAIDDGGAESEEIVWKGAVAGTATESE